MIGIINIDKPVSSFRTATLKSSVYKRLKRYNKNKDEFINNHFQFVCLLILLKITATSKSTTGTPLKLLGINGKTAKISTTILMCFSLIIFPFII